MNRILPTVLFVLLALFPAGSARAQCATWLSTPFSGPGYGTDGEVNCFLNWDPDGSGPDPTWLIVGGEFHSVDGVPADNIAAWDGFVWRALGFGTNGPVRALANWNGQLIVGGNFQFAGNLAVKSVARYTAGAWSPMGNWQGTNNNALVYALAVHNGTLFVGGSLPVAYGATARWNGSDWATSPSGIGSVTCFVQFNGMLLAGGSYGSIEYPAIKQYNGTSWSDFEPALTHNRPHGVESMAVVGTALYVAALTILESSAHITRYDLNFRVWNDLAGGPCYPRVLYDRGGTLYAAGNYCCSSPNSRRVQYYAGNQWWPVGALGPDCATVTPDGVNALVDYNGLLYAGGEFRVTGGDWPVGIARWNGTTWSVPQSSSFISALRPFGTKMVLGGLFSTATPAGQAYHLATWDGNQLASFPGPNAPVYAMYDYTDSSFPFTKHLVIGGGFNRVGNVSTFGIASWNETSDMPPSWSAIGSGFNNTVLVIDSYRGKMVAGGLFTGSGSTPMSRIARLSSGAWTAMGSGFNGAVRALKYYTDRNTDRAILVAGGDFTMTGSSAVSYISGWSESLSGGPTFTWGPFGGGFNAPVYALEYYNSSLYAAGNFTASTAGTALNRIARSTTSGWVPVGTATTGGGLNGNVTGMEVINGFLYVTGSFTAADGVAAYRIARWDGTSWSGVGGGTSGAVMAVAGYGSEVVAGGDFDQAGSTFTWDIARYSASGAPWVVTQPTAQAVSEGATSFFKIEPASGYSGVTYQWRRNNVAVVNGLTPGGSTITGANQSMILISNTAAADSGNYSCQVSNGCGAAVSGSAKLTVQLVSGVGDLPLGVGRIELAAGRSYAGSAARLAWTLPIAMSVRLDIFDVQGRRLATLAEGPHEAGRHESDWQGTPDGRVPPGIYFARLSGSGAIVTTKVVVTGG
ncbi:MAG TPA: immunoglobulin domain-containing protein [Candidatus Eisenbacteria bacterium]